MFSKHKFLLINLAVLLFVGLIFLFPFFQKGFYLSHDGEAQVARFGAYVKGFLDGQFPIRWAGDLNYRYGSSVLIFYYPLTGLAAIPLNIVGISLENSFKLIIGFSFVICFSSFFLWIRELTKDNRAAFAGALVYGLAPYHFLNLYVRGDIAELLALGLVPFVFYFIEINRKERIEFTLLSSVFYALVILSHNSVSLVFSPIILLYAIFRSKDKKSLFSSFLMILLGLMMSAFFWLPAIIEAKYTNAQLFMGDMFKNNFPSFSSLIYSNWGFGADVNKAGGLSPQLGIIAWAFVLLSTLFIFRKNKYSKDVIFWMVIFWGLIFLTIGSSSSIWKIVPFLKELQFPWRFVGISSFVAAVLASLSISILGKKTKYIVIVLILLYSIQFVKIIPIKSKPDSFYFSYPGTTYYHGQASSIWTAGDFFEYPKNKIEIIGGRGKIVSQNIKSNLHTLRLDAKTNLSILDNTVYFPGWEVDVGRNKIPIEFQDMNHRGLIEFRVPEGIHSVKIRFGESIVRQISDYLSILGVVFLMLFALIRKRINMFKI